MDKGYKVTTNGRSVIAACMAAEKPLKLTRVGIGSGMVEEGVDLADVHELLEFVANGEISERSHEGERLNLTVQYANSMHKTVPTFYLTEFMVFAEDPDTGEETDLLYATLGDYRQPVPAYVEGVPGSVFSMPLVLVISNDLTVVISAAPGLITYDQLESSVATATREAMEDLQPGWSVCGSLDLTIPVSGWEDADPATEDYSFFCDVPAEGVTDAMVPEGTPLPGYFSVTADAGMMMGCTVINGAVRFYSQRIPDRDVLCHITLFRMGGSGGGGASVDPGVGLGFGMDGRLNVLLGNGLSVDDDNNINVDHAEVVTEDDMLDEDETEESLRNILTADSSEAEQTPESGE